MIKVIGVGMVLQLGLTAVLPAQQQAGIDKLFPAQPSGFVTDVANLLDNPTRDAIDARLDHLRSATGAEVAVVTLPTIGDYAPEDVAREIGRKWGVGPNAPIGDRRRNAGVLVLLVPHTSEHKGEIRVEVGQGAEGSITDARAGEIRDSMIPYLQQGQYGAGLQVGTAIISDIVARDMGLQDSSLVRPRPPPSTMHRYGGRVKLVLYLILFIIWLISLAFRNRGGRGGRGSGGGGLGSWIVPYMIGRSFGGGGFGGGGFGGSGFGGGGGGGFGGFGGGGGFSGGGAGGSF